MKKLRPQKSLMVGISVTQTQTPFIQLNHFVETKVWSHGEMAAAVAAPWTSASLACHTLPLSCTSWVVRGTTGVREPGSVRVTFLSFWKQA